MARLDTYEGSLYEKRVVDVRTTSNKLVSAVAYVIAKGKEHKLTSLQWDPESFRVNKWLATEEEFSGLSKKQAEPDKLKKMLSPKSIQLMQADKQGQISS